MPLFYRVISDSLDKITYKTIIYKKFDRILWLMNVMQLINKSKMCSTNCNNVMLQI